MTQDNDKIRAKLLQWYHENQRVLPWRGSGDTYKIWLSEIIMQQTRVAQGTPYYLRFIEKYPDIRALASADEQEILKLWQGLGYYSRARNLHKAAKQVVSDFNGRFPEEYRDIISLKGIGPYTAAAIASIAFNKPEAVVDGNVYRVLARLYGISTPVNANGAAALFQNFATGLLDKKRPGTFNEAIMEFGAMVCLPKNPLCKQCPLNRYCKAYHEKTQSVLPFKNPANEVKTRYFHYLFIKSGNRFYLNRRNGADIWKGMYDLPMIESQGSSFVEEHEAGIYLETKVLWLKPVKKITHKLTHQRLEIIFYHAGAENFSPERKKNLISTDPALYKQYPLPKPIEIFLNDYLCNPNFL